MITLAELQTLHADIKKSLKICKSTLNKFPVKQTSDLSKSALISRGFIQGLMHNLQQLSYQIDTFIEASEINGYQKTDELNWKYFPGHLYTSEEDKMAEILGTHEMLQRELTEFKLAYHQAERAVKFSNLLVVDAGGNRYVNLLPEDFSSHFIETVTSRIDPLLSLMSGELDVDKVNQQLSEKLNLNKIREDSYVHESFGIDGSPAYFEHQSVYTTGRETSIEIQNKKIEDFVNYYIKKSGLPGSIQPNLKALLTTYCCQGSLAFIPVIFTRKFFTLHGNPIANNAQNYSIYFSVEKNNNIKVQVLVDQNEWLSDRADLAQSGLLNKIHSNVKIEFNIAVNVFSNSPNFSLHDTKVACSFMTPKECPMTIEKSALKYPQQVPPEKREIMPSFLRYISKYLGYNSLKDFYRKTDQELNTQRQKDAFEMLDLYDFCRIVKGSNGKKLSNEEVEFLLALEVEYKKLLEMDEEFRYVCVEKLFDLKAVISNICIFVNSQLRNSDLSKEDKLHYVYWLQLARELKGFEDFSDEIHNIYVSLVKQYSKEDPILLIDIAKDDKELYQEIVNPDSILTKSLKLSDDYHAHMIAKYPSLLEGHQHELFYKILNNLDPKAKLLFKLSFLVEFSKNGGDLAQLNIYNLFNESTIQALLIAIKEENLEVLQTLNLFLERAPAKQVAYLYDSPLEKVLKNYLENMLMKQPEDLVQFLGKLRKHSDGKLISRFGVEFVMRLVDHVSELATSKKQENILFVFSIVSEFKKLLREEPIQSPSNVIPYLYDILDRAVQTAEIRLSHEVDKEEDLLKEEEKNEKLLNEKVELLIEESEMGETKLDQAEQNLKLSVKKIKSKEVGENLLQSQSTTGKKL